MAAGAAEAIKIIQTEPERREKLHQNAAWLREKLTAMGLDIGQSNTYIIPIMLGSSEKALAISDALYRAGYYLAAIRPPTVSPGTARLRLSVQSAHASYQLEGLCQALAEAKGLSSEVR